MAESWHREQTALEQWRLLSPLDIGPGMARGGFQELQRTKASCRVRDRALTRKHTVHENLEAPGELGLHPRMTSALEPHHVHVAGGSVDMDGEDGQAPFSQPADKL